MKFLTDFFMQDEIETTKLFPLLNCSKHEALLLREMVFLYMRGENEIEVATFLEQFYYARGFEVLPYLKELKHLCELGWIRHTERLESALSLRNAIISLSPSLLKLLEDGCIIEGRIKETVYKNSLEYLQDEWKCLNLVVQCNKSPALSKNVRLLESCDNYINSLASTIQKNTKKSAKKFKVLEYFQKNNFNHYEKLIFLLLTQAQYNGAFGLSMRELIWLGKTEEEKITLQSLLASKAKLLREGFIMLADSQESYSDLSLMEQEFCIPAHVFNSLVFEKSTRKTQLEEAIEKSDIFELVQPKKGLDNIVLQKDLHERFTVLLQHLNPVVHKRLKFWGIKEKSGIDSKILLYGESGTGKTSSVHALAKDLGQKILSLDCSKILSMYVGESEKNVRKIFDEYRMLTKRVREKPILLLDEADQLLTSRNDTTGNASRMYHQMQNIFLEQIEKFEGILIATTNLVDTLDSAFSRRFHYKIQFHRPDKESRQKIWAIHLPKNATFLISKEDLVKQLAEFDLSGGQIKIIVENTCYKVATRTDAVFSLSDFLEEVEKEQSTTFGNGKKMGFFS